MKRLFIRKLKEVLRLRYGLGLGQRQIAAVARSDTARSMSPETRPGSRVRCPLPEGWDDRQLEAALFEGTTQHAYEDREPNRISPTPRRTPTPSPSDTAIRMGRYRQAHPDDYATARYVKIYQQ